MTGDTLGCGGLVLGSMLAAAGVFYRIAISNPGGGLPEPAMDRWSVQVGTTLILLGAAIAIAGGVAGYLIERRRLRDANIDD